MRKVLYFIFGFMLLAMPLNSAESFLEAQRPKLLICSVEASNEIIEIIKTLEESINIAIKTENTALLKEVIAPIDQETILRALLYTTVIIEYYPGCERTLNITVAIVSCGLVPIVELFFEHIGARNEATLLVRLIKEHLFHYAATLSTLKLRQDNNVFAMFDFLIKRVRSLTLSDDINKLICSKIISSKIGEKTLLHLLLQNIGYDLEYSDAWLMYAGKLLGTLSLVQKVDLLTKKDAKTITLFEYAFILANKETVSMLLKQLTIPPAYKIEAIKGVMKNIEALLRYQELTGKPVCHRTLNCIETLAYFNRILSEVESIDITQESASTNPVVLSEEMDI